MSTLPTRRYARVLFAFGIALYTAALARPGQQLWPNVVGVVLIMIGSHGWKDSADD